MTELNFPLKPIKVCSGCGATDWPVSKYKICSRCCFAYYCSEECQKKNWPAHKQECVERDDFDRTSHFISFIEKYQRKIRIAASMHLCYQLAPFMIPRLPDDLDDTEAIEKMLAEECEFVVYSQTVTPVHYDYQEFFIVMINEDRRLHTILPRFDNTATKAKYVNISVPLDELLARFKRIMRRDSICVPKPLLKQLAKKIDECTDHLLLMVVLRKGDMNYVVLLDTAFYLINKNMAAITNSTESKRAIEQSVSSDDSLDLVSLTKQAVGKLNVES